MFSKILIANRGEIACRVIRSAHAMGIKTVAIYSDADRGALHVEMADEAVHIGPSAAAESYLVIDKVLAAIKETGAEAVHPGYGFLSENAAFVEALEAAGVAFIGPGTKAIAAMGDKIASKKLADKAGVSTVPGHLGVIADADDAVKIANEVGYPVMIKASAGGGGKGMRIANNDEEAREGFDRSVSEAMSSFGDDRIFIEKYIVEPRHIEIQILADSHGNVVHLGERDCSLQRRHQKVLEEAPSPALNASQRAEIGETVSKAISGLGYLGAGTVEFLYEDGGFYFIEMNTRLQVEHPITEAITGIDIVREQLRIADGAPLSFSQDDITFTGHAIECRINAEDPNTFIPMPGQITDYHAPGGLDVRVDSAIYSGYKVPPYYDSLIAKLVVRGGNRNECIMRLRRALEEYVIGGVPTTLDVHRSLIGNADFQNGDYDIHWLENFIANRE